MQDPKMPRGVELITETFSDPKILKEMNSAFIKPPHRDASQGMTNPQDPYSVNGLFARLNRPRKETKKELIEEMITSTNESFTSIPRMMGIFGQYVAPPGKVSFSEMYEASLDSTIGSVLQVTKSMIINQVGTYVHPQEEVQALVRKCLEEIGGEQFLYRSLDFLKFGFAIGECIWDFEDGYTVLKDVVFAPQTNMQFMVDDKGKMSHALQPNLVASRDGTFKPANIEDLENLFAIRQLIPNKLPFISKPKDDLFYVAYDNVYSPYGISAIRRAYKYYLAKTDALEMLMTALSKNGAPNVVLYFNKNVVKDGQEELLKEAVDSLSLGRTLYLPFKKGEEGEAEVLEVDSSNIGIFLDFFKYCDQMIVRSMGFPEEILLGDSGSYSSGSIKKQTFEDMLQLYTSTLTRAIKKQVVKRVIENNFLDIDDLGSFVPDIREDDKLSKLKQFELGATAGVINRDRRSDVNHFRVNIGLDEIEDDKDLPANSKSFQATINKTNTRDTGQEYSHQEGERQE